MPTHMFSVITRPQYYAQLSTRIATTKPGDRVRLMTMGFKPEKHDITPILEALNAAAKRGVDVHLIVDAMTFLIGNHSSPGPFLVFKNLPQHLPPPFSARLRALETLRQNGGKFSIINKPPRIFKNPTAGRSHIKLALINNEIFLGGCNLTQASHLDLMVHWHDQRTATWLHQLVKDIVTHQRVRPALKDTDASFSVDSSTTLLIDAGKPGQSIIMDTALNLIDQAKEHIFITCQYFPNARIAKRLQAAHERGVSIKIIFNHPAAHYFPFNMGVASALHYERQRLAPALFTHMLPRQHDYLHAKLLATDQGTIIGSHNFVPAGVAFGTAEIALVNKTTGFAKQAVASLYQQLNITH